MPLPFLPGTLAVPLGVPLVAVAIALFSYSVAKFRAAGTPVPARKPTTVIVRTGPYRFSRNPIYLAFSVFQLGIAIWANSVWLLATLVGAVALIHYVVIRREEVRSTWTIRRPCAAGCKPPDPSGWSGPAHEAQIATPHIRVRRAARPTPLAREVGDSYLEWPAGFSNPQNSREQLFSA